jgi:glycosyltransferase involved in cell wall biosynthesis
MFLGTGALLGANQLDFPPHPNITVRRLGFVRPGWRQKLNFARFVLEAAWLAIAWRPSWVYVSDSLAAPAGLLVSLVPHVRVVYHEHDTPTDEGGPEASLFMRFVFDARRRLARRAQFCVLPNDERIVLFRRQTGTARRVVTVWNCPRKDEVRERPIEADDARLVLFYHGTLVPSRLPLSVIEALAQLPDTVVLRFAGYETVDNLGYVEHLFAEARQRGVAGRVEFLGALKREDLFVECASAHVGISFVPLQSADINVMAMVGASNKAFDYLACGVALLVSDIAEWKLTFVEAGLGRACDPSNAASVAQAIRWFLEHRAETREMGRRGQQRIREEWNYEAQFEPVRALISAAAG